MAVFSVLGMVGCHFLVGTLRYGQKLSCYPHEVHLVQEEMECMDCHDYEDGQILPTHPDRQSCADCHDKPEEEPMLATYYVDDTGRWTHAGRQSGEIILAHAAHTEDGETSCRSCHQDVATSSAIHANMRMRMEDCTDCHRQKVSRPEACSTCHKNINRSTPPRTHAHNWRLQHGPRWRSALGERTVDRCNLCHTQGSCDACHRTERPRSHNQAWRSRGHGLLAGIDRSRCQTCHTRAACDRCHSSERPKSHRGSFGNPLNRHCLSCHVPLGSGEQCGVCHISTPSHNGAPLLPSNASHRLASEADCRSCHAPLPHPDSGDNCRLCHR